MEVAFIKTASNSVRFNAKVSPTYFPILKKYADNHFKCKMNEFCKFCSFMDDLEQDLANLEEDLANLEEDLAKCVKNNSEALEHYNILSSFHNELSNTDDCNFKEDVIIVRYIDTM